MFANLNVCYHQINFKTQDQITSNLDQNRYTFSSGPAMVS